MSSLQVIARIIGLAPLALTAAPIGTTSLAECEVTRGGLAWLANSHASHCLAVSQAELARAEGVVLAVSPGHIEIIAEAEARNHNGLPFEEARVSVSATSGDEGVTLGPIRPGWIALNVDGLVGLDSGEASLTFEGSGQSFSVVIAPELPGEFIFVPFELGRDFFYTINAGARAFASTEILNGGYARIDVSLTFFEEDGVTFAPVGPPVPEPGTCPLVALGGIIMFCWKNRKKSCTAT
jgi:hypothetical protein